MLFPLTKLDTKRIYTQIALIDSSLMNRFLETECRLFSLMMYAAFLIYNVCTVSAKETQFTSGFKQQPVPDAEIVPDTSRFIMKMSLKLVGTSVDSGEEVRLPDDLLLNLMRGNPSSFYNATLSDSDVGKTLDRDARLLYDGFGTSGQNNSDPDSDGKPFLSTAPSMCFNSLPEVDTSVLGFTTPPAVRYNYLQKITAAMIAGTVRGQRFPYTFDQTQVPLLANREMRRQLAAAVAADIAAVLTTNITNEIIREQREQLDGIITGDVIAEGSDDNPNVISSALQSLLILQRQVSHFDTSVMFNLSSINQYANKEDNVQPSTRQGFMAETTSATAAARSESNTIDFILTVDLDSDSTNSESRKIVKRFLRDVLNYAGANQPNNGRGGIPMPSVSRWLSAVTALKAKTPNYIWKLTASSGRIDLVPTSDEGGSTMSTKRYRILCGASFAALQTEASAGSDGVLEDTAVVVYRLGLILDGMDGAGVPWTASDLGSTPLQT